MQLFGEPLRNQTIKFSLILTIGCKFTLFLILIFFSNHIVAVESPRLLNEAGDLQLQSDLETLISEQDLNTAIDTQALSLVLVLVTDPDPNKPRLAEFNGRNMLYAASLPKIAILLGAAVEIDDGRLLLNEELHIDLDNMIRYSCNSCASKVLEQVGREELLDILQSPRFNFYGQKDNGGLWVGKDYGPNAAYHRDPLSGLSHGATAFQAARFYYKLQNGTLVSPQQTQLMMEALSKPGIRHKFVKGINTYPNLELFRKSGSWKNYHADSALVRGDGLAYIIVALTNSPKGAIWIEKLAALLHELAISYNARTH